MVIRQGWALRSLLAAALVAAACARVPEADRGREPRPELPYGRELEGALDRAQQGGPGGHDLGISAAVIVPGYGMWSGVSGYSHPGVPVAADMLFDAGSIAKSFEAALALKLAERGALDLDDPLSAWLGPFRNVDGGITIRQLLNHTSGIFNVWEHPEFPRIGADIEYTKRWPMEEVFTSFVREPYGPPGFAQHYSSTNYLLLTAVLEEHTVMSMGEPLPGRFVAAHPWADVDRDGDLDDLAGTPSVFRATLTHPVLRTTAGDLARWMHALYHDRTVLTAGSLEQMLTYPDAELPDPDGGRYGLGVVDFSKRFDMHVIGHAGSSPGYTAAALYLPDYGASVAWLINTGEEPPERAGALMSRIWSSLSGVLLAHEKPQR
jgi:D-alanyl-D-alanine carboxypeptidase